MRGFVQSITSNLLRLIHNFVRFLLHSLYKCQVGAHSIWSLQVAVILEIIYSYYYRHCRVWLQPKRVLSKLVTGLKVAINKRRVHEVFYSNTCGVDCMHVHLRRPRLSNSRYLLSISMSEIYSPSFKLKNNLMKWWILYVDTSIHMYLTVCLFVQTLWVCLISIASWQTSIVPILHTSTKTTKQQE